MVDGVDEGGDGWGWWRREGLAVPLRRLGRLVRHVWSAYDLILGVASILR